MNIEPVHSGSDVAVVIPFFQRTSGILSRTVHSALNQAGIRDFRIIVVDDGSPVRAREELGDLMSDVGDRIILVEQSNTGAAGARNKGLDCLPKETKYVAFLDSDDEWSPNHLLNARFALGNGFDFYFADFYQLGQNVTAFNRAKRINIAEHPLVPGSTEVREYKGDMINQILTGNILGTSVTAYAYHAMLDLRYCLGFRHTGEEYLFWLDIASRSKRIAFGTKPECRYGSGVNIYSESAWSQEKYLTVIIDDIKYRRRILKEYSITPAQRRFLKGRIRELRRSFTIGLLHHVRENRQLPSRKVLRDYLAVDPCYPIAMWPAALQISVSKIGV